MGLMSIKTKHVILLGGKINSGKNLVYDIVKDYNKDLKIERVYFAESLKNICRKSLSVYAKHINNVIDSVIDDLEQYNFSGYHEKVAAKELSVLKIYPWNWYEDKTESTRILLQAIGTDIVRNNVDELFWIKQAAKSIEKSDADVFIITDFRFPNELYDLKKILDLNMDNNYNIVTVNLIRNTDKSNDLIHFHESENAFKDFYEWCYIIDNDGGKKKLRQSVKTMFDLVIGKNI